VKYKEHEILNIDGLSGLLAYINSDGAKKTEKKSHARTAEGNKFRGRETWDECLDMMRRGWPEGLQKMAAAVDDVKASMAEPSPVNFGLDVTGQCFDVGAYLSGEPECWLSPDPEKPKKTYRIILNCCVNGDITAEQIINRGAAVVAMIDALQADPSNVVDLTIIYPIRKIKGKHNLCIRLHIGCSPLDIDSLSFVVSHPGFFRRAIFRVIEVFVGYAHCDGYGSAQEDTELLLAENAIYLPGSNGGNMDDFKAAESAAEWLQRTIKGLSA